MSGKPFDDDMTEDELVASTEAGEWETLGNIEERRSFWQQSARKLIDGKRRRISISIAERDLARLKAKALEEGMPYQTLINAILHKYVA